MSSFTFNRSVLCFFAFLAIGLALPLLPSLSSSASSSSYFSSSASSSSTFDAAQRLVSASAIFAGWRSADGLAIVAGIRSVYGRLRAMGSNTSSAGSQQESVHQFTVKDSAGNDVDLASYKGKVLLIVNVASQCGLTTTNYKELTQIHNKYKDQGLEVLAFPCNQFGGQEPGTNEEIKEFACTRFKAEFPIFDKVNVNGAETHPMYKFLKASKGGGILGDSIKWNFSKFLVDKDGKVVDRYAPTTSPSKIEKDIKKLL